MRRLALTVTPAAFASPALAHPGHLGTLAGHDHWIAGAAIGAAIAAGLIGALKGRRKRGDTAVPAAGEAADAPAES